MRVRQIVTLTALLALLTPSYAAIGDIKQVIEAPDQTRNGLFGDGIAAEINGRIYVTAPQLEGDTTVSAGAVYVFYLTSLVKTIRESSSTHHNIVDNTGLAISDGILAFGGELRNPQRRGVMMYNTNTWSKLRTLEHPTSPTISSALEFGVSLAFTNTRIVVGAPSDQSGGEVHMFNKFIGEYYGAIANPRLNAGQNFGTGIFTRNEELIVHEAPVRAHVFNPLGSRTAEIVNPQNPPETRLAFGNGKLAFVNYSSDETGPVNVYNAEGSSLLRSYEMPPDIPDYWGHAAAINGDMIAIGSPYATVNSMSNVGVIHIYSLASGELIRKIDNPMLSENPALAEGSNFGQRLIPFREGFICGQPKFKSSGSTQPGRVYIIDGLPEATVNDWSLYREVTSPQ